MANAQGYTSPAKFLHWLIVVLLIAQFIFAWTMPHIGRNTPMTTLISLHFTFGIILLIVSAVRLAWRATRSEPAPLDGVPPWHVLSARVVHWLLYVLLFVVPILGWINASWRGMPTVMFGMELPKLIGTRAPGWGWTGDVHTLLANYLMLTLVGLHVLLASIIISFAETGCCSECCRAVSSRLPHHLALPAFPGARKPMAFARLDFAGFLIVHVSDWRAHAHCLHLQSSVKGEEYCAADDARQRWPGDDRPVPAHQLGRMTAEHFRKIVPKCRIADEHVGHSRAVADFENWNAETDKG